MVMIIAIALMEIQIHLGKSKNMIWFLTKPATNRKMVTFYTNSRHWISACNIMNLDSDRANQTLSRQRNFKKSSERVAYLL